MNHKRLPFGSSLLQRSSSATKKDKMVAEKVDERCRKEMTLQLDLCSAVKEFSVLSSKELGSLIRDAENGIIKSTINESSFEITVENLARHLVEHISNEVSSLTVDEQRFRYLLSGLRLVHTLCDISSHHLTLARVLAEDTSVQKKMIDSIFHLISFLSQFGKKVNGSSLMVLYSALLSNSMYLLKSLISSEWKDIADVLLAHPEVDDFIIAAFTAVCININLLQATLTTQRSDSQMQSNNCVFHICESSLQFLQSLSKQMLFRERLVENKELCEGGVVLQLVENTLKLLQHDDPKLASVVNRLKTKVLSIMLLLCQAGSSSFMDMVSTQSKCLTESAVSEVLEVLKMMCSGDLKGHHPRGLLQLYAMQLTEIFCGATRFRSFMVLNLKEVLTRVFSQPQREFISTWCTYDHEPAEEEIIVDFNPTSAAGLVLGLISSFNVRHSTWSNFQAPQTPYGVQRSSLLVKIVANLASYDPDLSEDENAFFIDAFLECLQAESSNLPGGAAERKATATRNQSSLLAHAESLTPSYLHEEDLNVLRWFNNQLEKSPTAQESSRRRVMEVHNSTQLPSPTPQSRSPNEHDTRGNHEAGTSVNVAQNGQNQSMKRRRTKRIDLGEIRSVQTRETQQKKRRSIMNDTQIDMVEKALLDHTVLQRTDGSMQLFAAILSLHGPEVTPIQLKNWLSNHKRKRECAAAKEARVHSNRSEGD